MDLAHRRRSASRIAGLLRASASLGAAAGLLLAVAAPVAGVRPPAGVPAWAWLSMAFACWLVREVAPPPGQRPGRPR